MKTMKKLIIMLVLLTGICMGAFGQLTPSDARWRYASDFEKLRTSPCHWDETGRYVRQLIPGAPHLGTCYRPGQEGPGGGMIIYHNHNGFTVQGYGNPGDPGYFPEYTAYYLEARNTNAAQFNNVAWSTTRGKIDGVTTFLSADDPLASAIGNGRRDTLILANHFNRTGQRNTAAQICANYSVTENGVVTSDWFLPSAGEMSLLSSMEVRGGSPMYWFTSNTSGVISWFWTSSQTDANYAWHEFHRGGFRSVRNLFGAYKAEAVGRVRPMRAF